MSENETIAFNNLNEGIKTIDARNKPLIYDQNIDSEKYIAGNSQDYVESPQLPPKQFNEQNREIVTRDDIKKRIDRLENRMQCQITGNNKENVKKQVANPKHMSKTKSKPEKVNYVESNITQKDTNQNTKKAITRKSANQNHLVDNYASDLKRNTNGSRINTAESKNAPNMSNNQKGTKRGREELVKKNSNSVSSTNAGHNSQKGIPRNTSGSSSKKEILNVRQKPFLDYQTVNDALLEKEF